ncbi:hypothetical protein Aph02nite_78570 [Actinoplanes philippinensis]|nr:hypothetical protein Aph02nite_78570 [Actinoplanes philippinensis]
MNWRCVGLDRQVRLGGDGSSTGIRLSGCVAVFGFAGDGAAGTPDPIARTPC